VVLFYSLFYFLCNFDYFLGSQDASKQRTLLLLYFLFFFSFLGEGATAFGYELELFRGTPEYFAGLEQVYWV
jgi:hypothetical protein